MRRRIAKTLHAFALLALWVAPVLAQGVQTGDLVGSVRSADGQPLPGVSVTVRSEALLGERTAVTEINGDFLVRNLPPGAYVVVFALEGMQTVERSARVRLGATSRVDAALEVMSTSETIVVEGESPSALETITLGANFGHEMVDALPISRDFTSIAELAGGLTTNTPNDDQLTISGGFAWDNTFMVNGVDVTENYFGDFDNLFIEDAIAETQVLTAGISAEYGRFSGGVVNAITKSGGNAFSGSVRLDLEGPRYQNETPFEKERGIERSDDLSEVYQATIGGPIVKDRAWFFGAVRLEDKDEAISLLTSGLPIVTTTENDRYQLQATASLAANHTIAASYTSNDRIQANVRSTTRAMDLASVIDRELPNEGWSLSYNGVLTSSLFGEMRYSEKTLGFREAGGSSRVIFDSPFRSQGVLPGTAPNRNYNAPYFDATDPEDRDNSQLYGALSWFLSSASAGSHDLKIGYERFVATHVGGNSQTSTDYVFYTDYRASGGQPTYDADGRVIPVFTPFLSGVGNWIAERNAKLDLTTDALFVNDRWNLGTHWSLNLGVRYEATNLDTKAGLTTIDTESIVPRLGVGYDLHGDGKYRFDVSYSEYAGRFNASLFASNTNVGQPSLLYGYYVGPAGEGRDFAPGFDPANYVFYYAAVPTANIFVDRDMSSQRTQEIAVSAGMELPGGGYLKLSWVDRDYTDFVEDVIRLENGSTLVELGGVVAGEFDNVRYQNSSEPVRRYRAAVLQGSYRIRSSWTLGGSWTHQFENEGNYEGEAENVPGATSTVGDYPELYVPARNFPIGRFDDYQEDKLRLWTSYALELGRAGALDIGVVYRYDSPLTYSLSTPNIPFSAEQLARDPGYASPPRSQRVYFGPRGVGEFEPAQVVDFSLGYRVPVWRSLEPWVKLDVRNLFDEDALVAYDTVVSANRNGPLDADGLPTTFTRGPNFGRATSADDHVSPREYKISAGVRF